MTCGEWLFSPGSADFKWPRTILASEKNPPNCYQHLKVPCSGMPFFRQKKPTKQNKLKQNKTSTGTYYNTITIPEYTNTMVWDPSKGQNTQNRSFFERFQGPPWPPWSLSKVVIGQWYISLDAPWPLDLFLDLSVPPRVQKVQKSDFFATKVKVEPKVKVIIVQTRMDEGPP